MVDIVARVVVEDDDTRTLNFKQNEVIFGGGRLKGIEQTSIPLSWNALMEVYEKANQTISGGQNTEVNNVSIDTEKVTESENVKSEEVVETSNDERVEAPEEPKALITLLYSLYNLLQNNAPFHLTF